MLYLRRTLLQVSTQSSIIMYLQCDYTSNAFTLKIYLNCRTNNIDEFFFNFMKSLYLEDAKIILNY